MRLFVGVWPDEQTVAELSLVVPDRRAGGLRWVAPSNWHVTLAFLGSVPEAQCGDVAGALRSFGPSARPTTATLGPTTCLLGRGVLCVPVLGLEELALGVREVTDRYHLIGDDDIDRFVGHLTLARARRGAAISRDVTGATVSSSWKVDEIRLVSSTLTAEGSRYEPREIVALGG